MHLTDAQRWLLRTYWPVGVLFLFVIIIATTQLERGGTADERVAEMEAPSMQGEQSSADVSEEQSSRGEIRETIAEGQVLNQLIVPVEGVQVDDLYDSFYDERGDRLHEAIDIMAERGTEVLAAAPGTIGRMHESAGGGKSLYKLGPDSTYVFYYAHLDAYADGIEEGRQVAQGEVLGTVGSTGNAHDHAPHLHFAIWEWDEDWIWEGETINPYPLFGEE